MPNRPAKLSDVPLNFLLSCSEQTLDNYQLMRMAAVSDIRNQIVTLEDRMADEMGKAALAAWFRTIDRDALKYAIDHPEDPMAWAREQIRNQGKEGQSTLPLPPPDPQALIAAHRVAAVTYQNRNIAEGKCMSCPKPLDPNSVRYCTKHLAMVRSRASQKKALSIPGSREFLYAGEIPQSPGRSPSNLARLAMNREQKTRAVLAELGISSEDAAVSLNAAKEALLKCMPTSKDEPMTAAELFDKACIPTSTTGKKALQDLLSAGRIERTGKGGQSDPFRYSLVGPPERRKQFTKSRVRQNQAIQAILKGEAE